MSLLVGGRGSEDDDEGPGTRRRLPLRGLLVLVGACAATGLAVAVPQLLAGDGAPPAREQLAADGGWQGVRVCRTEPPPAPSQDGCVERDAATAERLADVLLPLAPFPEDLLTCLAVGERYTVVLRGDSAPPELVVDTACGPVLAPDGARYEVSDEGRAAVAAAWADAER